MAVPGGAVFVWEGFYGDCGPVVPEKRDCRRHLFKAVVG